MGEFNSVREKERIVLMSLHKEYFKQMIHGEKHYEYRKRYCKEASTAYIYLPEKEKQIAGVICFEKPIIAKSKIIAELAEEVHDCDYDEMLEYLSNDIAYAIPIRKVGIMKPIGLNEIREKIEGFMPPQSYYYLDKKPDLLEFIRERQMII